MILIKKVLTNTFLNVIIITERGVNKKMTKSEIEKALVGKTIVEAGVSGYGIYILFSDGFKFYYNASDGGYSSYELTDEEEEEEENE